MVGKHQARGRDDVDAERAWAKLVEMYGVEVAKAAMTLKASRSSIRDAVGAMAPRGKKKAFGDSMIALLEHEGVITAKYSEDVGPYEPTEVLSVPPALAVDAGSPPSPSSSALLPPGVNEAQETQ
jgi:hypothetical protein